ncbi:MAG: hypothetical protein PVG41_07870 [Desulfobacteraceae bacterium]|jgi:hypothetical protein
MPARAVADIDIHTDTIVRSFEQRADSGEVELVLPVYGYLGIDYGDAEQGGLSFNLYGWERKDSADSDLNLESSKGKLHYGHLGYQKPDNQFDVGVGHRHFFAGVADQSDDGLRLTAGIGPNMSTFIFEGLSLDYQDHDGGSINATIGTRLAYHIMGQYKIGLFYQKTDADGDLSEKKAGADFLLRLGSRLTLSGLSSYNIDSEDWSEHRYDARVLVSHLMIEPSFQYVSYQDYFGKGNAQNNIFHFLQNEEEILAISGTDVMWQGLGGVDIGVRGRHYDYDIRQESALYMAGLLTVNTASGSQIGIEIGRMDGETADNLYDLYRGYFYWHQPLRIKTQGFISGDALYIAYDAPVYGEDKSIQYSLSAGRRFFDNRMETKLSGIFSQDPYFDSDVGGAVTLHIHY